MIEHKISLVSIERVRPHERAVEVRVRELLRDLEATLILRKPVVVDEETLTLLDGHHRLQALRRLGVELVPAALVRYSDPRIVVRRWGSGELIDKRLVIERAKAFPAEDHAPPGGFGRQGGSRVGGPPRGQRAPEGPAGVLAAAQRA
jgi:hypothetical protein